MRERGFTVLEMIVATTIMGIAVVGLLEGISASSHNAARLRDYDRIVQLSRLQINQLLLDPRLPRDTVVQALFDRELTGGLEAGWQARLSTFERPPVMAAGQLTLERLELEVWWMSGARRRTFTLEAFRQRVLKPEDIVPVVPQ